VRYEISGSGLEPESMIASSAYISRDGIEEVIFEDDITLSTNDVRSHGESGSFSSASLSIDVKTKKAVINTVGNASVRNKNAYQKIQFAGGKKNLKALSSTGWFASVKLKYQRNAEHDYVDVYFGISGREEKVTNDGQKDRPHISFYPDGNGKFIRLSGYKCILKGELTYDTSTSAILPVKLKIEIEDSTEDLILIFQHAQSDGLILAGISFEKKNA
jgi:hypothetical protein